MISVGKMENRERIKQVILPPLQIVGQRLKGRHYSLNDDSERIYLHHIRKTGGTSLYSAFLALGGEDPLVVQRRLRDSWLHITRTGDYVIAAHQPRAVQQPRYFFGWSHHPAWSIRLPSRTFSVTILRDPAARVLSLYRYLVDPRADMGQPYSAAREERQMAADGFDRFLDRLPRSKLLGQLHMFSRACDPQEAASRIEECSLAFFLDDMEAALQKLSELIDCPLNLRHERRSVGAFQPSDLQHTRLLKILAPEYSMMNMVQLGPSNRVT